MSKSIINAPLGNFNKVINLCYSYKILKPFSLLFKMVMQLELPNGIHQKKLRLPHPYNIIINSKTKLSNNVTVYHNVTLGSKREGYKAGVPIVGDNVIIYPSAIIIGSVKIGENAVIGAGSIVNDDVKPFTIVAGNPAKLLKEIPH